MMLQASLMATCEQCQSRFAPQDGGICGQCGQLLCGWHLYGFLGRLRSLLRHGPGGPEDGVICTRCRERREPG